MEGRLWCCRPGTVIRRCLRPQAQFEGSRRQARGLLLKRLGQGAVVLAEVPDIVNRSPAQAHEVVDGLVKDGLCVLESDSLRLP